MVLTNAVVLAGAGRGLQKGRPAARTPGGALALFLNVHVYSDASGGFFDAAQGVFEREALGVVGPENYKGLP